MTTKAQRQAEFVSQLNVLLLTVRDKAMSQFEYNETTNIPQAIIQSAESVTFALRHGMAAGWNKCNEWDTVSAMQLAHEVLEDANCHSEAGPLWESLQKELARS